MYTSSLVSRPQCKRYCVFCSLAVLSIKYSKERNWISLIPYFQLRLLFGDCKIRYSGRVEIILNVNVSREMSQVIVRRWGKDEQNMAGLCNKEPWVGVLCNKESLVVVLCNKSQHPTNVQQGGAAHSKGLTFPRYKSLYVRIAYAPRYFSLCLPHHSFLLFCTKV